MSRTKTLPDWTKEPPTRRAIGAAEHWAKTVQSDVVFETGPRDARETISALNRETRQVLVAIARDMPGAATRCTFKVAELVAATGFSGYRLRWHLSLLCRARLVGPVKPILDGKDVILQVDLNMGLGEHKRAGGGR